MDVRGVNKGMPSTVTADVDVTIVEEEEVASAAAAAISERYCGPYLASISLISNIPPIGSAKTESAKTEGVL